MCIEMIVVPQYGVDAKVSLIVDTTNTEDVEVSIDDFESSIDEVWSIELQSIFITSSPTSVPSTVPSAAPITLQPSAQPSISGLVVTIHVNLIFFSIVSKDFVKNLLLAKFQIVCV